MVFSILSKCLGIRGAIKKTSESLLQEYEPNLIILKCFETLVQQYVYLIRVKINLIYLYLPLLTETDFKLSLFIYNMIPYEVAFL